MPTPMQNVFIGISLIFIAMAIKGHANVLVAEAAEKKAQAQKQKAPLYYRTATS